MPAPDGEEFPAHANGGMWRLAWYPAAVAPAGKPHGANALCETLEGEIVRQILGQADHRRNLSDPEPSFPWWGGDLLATSESEIGWWTYGKAGEPVLLRSRDAGESWTRESLSLTDNPDAVKRRSPLAAVCMEGKKIGLLYLGTEGKGARLP